MKKLLLGLLLLSGLAIQAEEPAVQPEVPKEAEQDAAQVQYKKELKELLEKEKAAVWKGIEEKAKALKPLAQEIEKLDDEGTEESWNQAEKLKEEMRRRTSSFGAKSIRGFSNYSADEAAYLGYNRYLNLKAALGEQLFGTSDAIKKEVQEFKESVFNNATKNDLEELGNCIRSNELPDKEKDSNCVVSFGDKIIKLLMRASL